LKSTTKQQVTCLVASVGSPPLRQAATTLPAIANNVRQENKGKLHPKIQKIVEKES